MIVTIYKDVFDKSNPYHKDVFKILERIKSGNDKPKVDLIRGCNDVSLKKKYKEQLPSICFSGTFSERKDDCLIQHSGLVVLDFDHVEKLQELKDEICKDEYTFAAFISPSGDGLKVLVKIPPEKENHAAYYLGLIKKYPALDSTSINISRVCFSSYDPKIYINSNSTVWTTKGKTEKSAPKVSYAQQTDFARLNICADIIRMALDGEKHKELIRASRLAGGFIAGGIVEEHEAIRVLEIEINKKDITDFKAAQKTIQDGIEYGKKDPIYEQIRLKLPRLSKKEDVISLCKEEEIIDESEPAKDVIYLDDVKEEMLYSFRNGTSRGETTHFPDLDEKYRMKRGELNVSYGLANHGKSTFVMQLALIKAVKDGYKWGVFSPENFPTGEFYKDIIHAYVGKSTEKHHHNQMTEAEFMDAMEFVKNHFYYIYPENDSPTPAYINKRFRELIIKHGIDGCIIDPYNQLDNDIGKSGKEHLYLSSFLSTEKRFAAENNIFSYIITHPRGDAILKGSDYECPKVYQLSGGAMWNNKADNIFAIHRPNYSDWEDKLVVFESVKIKKQKLCGIPGRVELNFDRATGRYYQNNGLSPLENRQWKTTAIPVNTVFDGKKAASEPENIFSPENHQQPPF